ncbi:SusC/RagA family TonB-linked outer membrane protein [Flavobacterium restrictum]|uniref:SusC/RagA family TonB-linked outer membrane protein n=1 Tax=Flavobacterium restrictum TaxID=2594428 RepID=A0A553E373_9FLAO|nr:SusC/RagA family TonB-linked outer membrane protein [Flavobacterium restrictum]TRX39410.1 SusC/RagA family TonB-linked outer membrane protein [Flavobacterium restrictum]
MKTIYKKLLFLLLLLPMSMLAQNVVSGTVVDAVTKQPIPGVNVNVQGTSNGVSTDFDGNYKLPNVKKGDKIIFSFIGYKSASVSYDSQKSLTVSLTEESNQLQEVVIQVGYGSAKKKDATGSVALVTAKDFNKGAIVSTDQLLAGKAAGVRITNSGGQPDASPNIRIRGGASLNASNNPLIIIDGVPIGDNNPAGVSNPFTLINPNDVESFSILKDASATAIYGVRASNGVILITTKKGTTGAPQFNYSANVSIGQVGKKLNVMNGVDFTKFIQQYHPTKTNQLGIDDPTTDAVDNLATPEIEGRILSNTDWQDVILRTSISTDHNFSARANLYKKIPFRASVGYNKTQGLVRNSDYERLSYSFKMTPKLLHDDLKIDINAKGTYTNKNTIDEDGALGGALSMDPTKPVYGDSFNNKFDGYYQSTLLNGNRDLMVGSTNPLALLEQRKRPERAVRFLGNVEFDYKLPFLRDLRAVVNLGLDASQSRIRESFANNALATYTFNQGTDHTSNYLFNPGMSYLENQTSTNKTMDAYLAYSKTYTGFVTKFDAQAGYSYQDFRTDGYSEQFRNNIDTGLREPNINANNPNNRYYSPLNLQAFFGRTNVDLLGKYLFTATLRTDASSLFTPENRWGIFPAVGGAWKIKEEAFLKDSKLFQDLKLRLGWGRTGQSNIPNRYFPSRPLFTPGNVTSQYLPNITTYTPLPYNADLTWEKTTTYNLGLDFELFTGSILSGAFDVYHRKTTDLLANVPFAAGGTGGSEFIKNVGSMEGDGLELSLNVKAVSSDDFNLNFGGNIAYNYSKISNLKELTVTPDTGSTVGGTGVYLAYNPVGYQPYSAWVFQQIYDAKGQPIVGAYTDFNGDGVITNADKYYKSLRPNWTFGFNTSINYKNWDLAANFRGQLGGQVYNRKVASNGSIQSAIPQNGNSLNNVLNFYDGTANPIFDNFIGNEQFSDYLLEDATFLRCDNISLSYKFAKFINKSSLRVSGSVNNAFIITNYSGQDPESFNAIDGNFYPRPITYTFGVSLDF